MRKIHWSSDCARTIEEQKKIYSGVLKSITDEVEFLREYKKNVERQLDEQTEKTNQLQQKLVELEKEYAELKTHQNKPEPIPLTVTFPDVPQTPILEKEQKKSEAKRRAKHNTGSVSAS